MGFSQLSLSCVPPHCVTLLQHWVQEQLLRFAMRLQQSNCICRLARIVHFAQAQFFCVCSGSLENWCCIRPSKSGKELMNITQTQTHRHTDTQTHTQTDTHTHSHTHIALTCIATSGWADSHNRAAVLSRTQTIQV